MGGKAQKIKEQTGYVLSLLVSIYMLLILVVQPLYSRQGFSHIGTDKAYFFQQCSMRVGFVLLPVLALHITVCAIIYIRENKDKSKYKYKYKHKNIRRRLQGFLGSNSVTDLYALLYVVSVLVSYACCRYKEEALRGTQGWYMGLTTQLSLVAIYFMVSRAWEGSKKILLSILPVSALVFLLGIENRFGIYPIDMQGKENVQYLSTIGNINWYCGYLVSVFFGGLVVLWQTDWQKWQYKAIFAVYAAIGFTTLVTQGSSSGIVAMVAVLLVMFCFSAAEEKRMYAFSEITGILSAVCLALWLIQSAGIGKVNYVEGTTELLTHSIVSPLMAAVSFAFLAAMTVWRRKGKYPASAFKVLSRIVCWGAAGIALFVLLLIIVNTAVSGRISDALGMPEENYLTFTLSWGSNRGATWKAAAMCFAEQDFLHKLVGVGPDCMSAFLSADRSEELHALVEGCFGASRLTNAHNEWLTTLVDMGILGLVSYAGMMCTAIARLLKARKASLIAGVCGFCVLAYTVNNMFSFQQSMNAPTIFILLGVGENCLRKTLNRG